MAKSFKWLWLTVFACVSIVLQAQEIDFKQNKTAAGKASLSADGFYADFVLGMANFSPELRMPVQIFYDSACKEEGLLGAGWKIPQFESKVSPDKEGAVWTTPWGEKISLIAREKADKETLSFYNEQTRENAFFSPFGDWTANGKAETGAWTLYGRKDMKGWRFVYLKGNLTEITAPSGQSLQFSYEGGLLKAVKQNGEAFIALDYADKTLASLSVNGVPYAFQFTKGPLQILPNTAAGKEQKPEVLFLSSVQRGNLNPLSFKYDTSGFLTQIKRGDYEDNIAVEHETLAQRKAYFAQVAKAIKDKVPLRTIVKTQTAGRILSDANFKYTYPSNRTGNVRLENALNQTALYNYDGKTGVFEQRDFSGKTLTTYYFMRYDVGYNGKVRQIVDGQGRVVANYRYDKDNGKVTRARDMAKNDVNFKYDSKGNLVLVSKRGADENDALPVQGFDYLLNTSKPSAIKTLNARGEAVRTTLVQYDKNERPTLVDDGQNAVKIAYNAFGYPVEVSDALGSEVKMVYDRYNRVISQKNPNGSETQVEYGANGQVSRRSTRFEGKVLTSVEIAYDGDGNAVSYKDQNGLVKAYAYNSQGKVQKEIFPDHSRVAYTYDAIGNLAKVLDQNSHEIRFQWNQYGLDARITAVGQITQNSYDTFGRRTSVESKFEKKTPDRVIQYAYDALDRVSQITYGKGQVETLQYDSWGRVTRQAKNDRVSTFRYDYFGRLIEQTEADTVNRYTYDPYGNRLSRITQVGDKVLDEYNTYDKFGRLLKRQSNGKSLEYKYGKNGKVAEQIVDGHRIVFEYTPLGQLSRKALLWPDGSVVTELKYFYSADGKITGRLANGQMQEYQYDAKMQLLAVVDAETKKPLEQYVYDPAGNILKKTIDGETTEYTFDAANQLVSGIGMSRNTTEYAYDAAGRMIKDGEKSYAYGWLDKVLEVAEQDKVLTQFVYCNNGQLDNLWRKSGARETFVWDSLALIERNGVQYINERHCSGGTPVLSMGMLDDTRDTQIIFTDMLGTSLGKEIDITYSQIRNTAFGNTVEKGFFTGKPYVEELGYVFLFRNYHAETGKWLSQDLIGYPDGWNNLAYCNNRALVAFDRYGLAVGDIYRTANEAAIAWGNEFNGQSIGSNREYASIIYVNGEGPNLGYSYNTPNIGDHESSNPSPAPDGKTAYADIHSHGAYDPAYGSGNDDFSTDDKAIYVRDNLVGYVATTDGHLLIFDPNTGGTNTVSSNLPSDPNHPSKGNQKPE